jgi:hypothetical protein
MFACRAGKSLAARHGQGATFVFVVTMPWPNPWALANLGASVARYVSLNLVLLLGCVAIVGLGTIRTGGVIYYRYQAELESALEETTTARKKVDECTEQYGSALSFDVRWQEVCAEAVQKTRIDPGDRAANATWNSLPTVSDFGLVLLNGIEHRLYALCGLGVLVLLGTHLVLKLQRACGNKQAKKRVAWLQHELASGKDA